MRICKLRIKNLNSLRIEQEIDFLRSPLGDTGLFAIIGDTGAGKTTLLDAITIALYGRVARSAKAEEMLTYGTGDGYAEVEFESGGETYLSTWSVHRAKNQPDGRLQPPKRSLARWDADKKAFEIIGEKVREIDTLTETITGLDFERFSKSVLLAQGDFAAFLKADATDRSQLLERITGTEIYTRLSKAAYFRHKTEKARVEAIEGEIAHFQLLDGEERETLEKRKRELSIASGSLRRRLAEFREMLNSLEALEKESQRLEKLESEKQELDHRSKALESELRKLERHKKAIPFHSDLNHLAQLEKEVQEKGLEKQGYDGELRGVEKELTEAAGLLAEMKSAQEKREKENKELQNRFDEAILLEATISDRQKPFLERQSRLEKARETAKNQISQIQLESERLESLKQALSELEEWLSAHETDALLTDYLPRILDRREQLRKTFRQEKEILGELSELKVKFQQFKGKRAGLDAKLKGQRSELRSGLEKLLNRFPESGAKDPSGMRNWLSMESGRLESWRIRVLRLQELLREQASLSNRLDKRIAEIQQTEKLLRDAQEKVLRAEKELEERTREEQLRRQLFEQQQKISNYERDRQQLKEGDPCPLCGSTDHPFHDADTPVLVAETRSDLEQATQCLEQQRSVTEEARRSWQELEYRLAHLTGEGETDSEGPETMQERLNAQRKESRKLAESLEVSPGLLDTEPPERIGLPILDRWAMIRQQMPQIEKQLTGLARLEESISEGEKSLKALEEDGKELERSIRDRDRRLQEVLADRKSEISPLNKWLSEFGYVFPEEDPGRAAPMFKDLVQRKTEWEKRQKKLPELRLELSRQEGQIKESGVRQEQLHNEIQGLEKEVDQLGRELEKLEVKRKATGVAPGARAARERWEADLQHYRNAVAEKEELVGKLRTRHQVVETSLKHAAAQLMQSTNRRDEFRASLENRANAAGFPNLPSVGESLLKEEQVTAIRRERDTLQEEMIRNRQSIAEAHSQLEDIRKRTGEGPGRDQLEKQIGELDAELEAQQKEFGSIDQNLRNDDHQRSRVTGLTKTLDRRRRELVRWARLNDLIGMASGDKFRSFAQALTLEKLTLLANQHLAELNGRYIIHKREGENLELEIRDTFQADNVRSLNTLSGGETFLVSLALALGLSDLAGHRTRIRSLFIDEGFGTLDDETLDTAITTLENLQARGKTIGIISHVKALKERIGTQIRVVKKGSGFSELQIVP